MANIAETPYTGWVDSQTQIEVPRLLLQHNLQQYAVGPLIIPSSLSSSSSRLTILDVGPGPAHWLLSLCDLYPSAELYGVDITEKMYPPLHSRPPNLHLVLHNILEPLPVEWHGKFDLVNAKNLFLWLSESVWDEVLRNMMSVLKPGGWIQLVDYGPWYPDTGVVGRLHRLRNYILDRTGLSPTKITSMPSHVESAGFVSVHGEPKRYPIGDKHPVAEFREPSVEAIMPIFKGVKENGLRGQKVTIGDVTDVYPETDEEYDILISEAVGKMRESGSGILQITIGQKPQATSQT